MLISPLSQPPNNFLNIWPFLSLSLFLSHTSFSAMEDDEACITSLSLGLGMGGHVPKKEKQKLLSLSSIFWLLRLYSTIWLRQGCWIMKHNFQGCWVQSQIIYWPLSAILFYCRYKEIRTTINWNDKIY